MPNGLHVKRPLLSSDFT